MGFKEVIHFWFVEIEPKRWWQKDTAFDRQILEHFGKVHESANRCELFSWRSDPEGRLAEIIVLDQFSRNMFRGEPASFASDPLALCLAQEAVAIGTLEKLEPSYRPFLVMPYMHSESVIIHQKALELFQGPGMEGNLEFEKRHKEIIDRFGRYPHRNEILGRKSTPEEMEFLKEPGSSF